MDGFGDIGDTGDSFSTLPLYAVPLVDGPGAV